MVSTKAKDEGSKRLNRFFRRTEQLEVLGRFRLDYAARAQLANLLCTHSTEIQDVLFLNFRICAQEVICLAKLKNKRTIRKKFEMRIFADRNSHLAPELSVKCESNAPESGVYLFGLYPLRLLPSDETI